MLPAKREETKKEEEFSGGRGRKSAGRKRIFKPPRFHHFHPAPDMPVAFLICSLLNRRIRSSRTDGSKIP
jgi:hypothetical protein